MPGRKPRRLGSAGSWVRSGLMASAPPTPMSASPSGRLFGAAAGARHRYGGGREISKSPCMSIRPGGKARAEPAVILFLLLSPCGREERASPGCSLAAAA